MNNNKMKTSLFIIAILFITMLVVSGGTFAYLQWMTSDTQLTAINVSVTDDINMYIDPAAVTKTGMRPTNNCAGDFAMVGTSTVTINNQTGTQARPRLKLKLKITDLEGNNITNETSPAGQKYMYYIKYAVTEENGSCTDSLAEGRFNLTTETSTGSGWYDSPSLTLDTTTGFPDLYTSVSFKAKENAVTSHTYKVTVWIDENYTTVNEGNTVVNDKLQNATITVSWSDNSTVEQVDSIADRPLTEAYAVYSADDSSLRFYRSSTPITAGSTYNGLTVTAVYTGFEDESYIGDYSNTTVPWYSYRKDIINVMFEDVIVPTSTSAWFYFFENSTNIDVTKLNTSNVTNMSSMFSSAGQFSTTLFEIVGLNNWDTSSVTDMSYMFKSAGNKATTWSIGDISGWDVSNVTSMIGIFSSAGSATTTWSIGNISGWDTSSLVDARSLFNSAASNATTFDIGNLSGWDVSNVTNMFGMFNGAGRKATTWNIGNISGWDTSNVTNMQWMFRYAGVDAEFSLDLSVWNVCNVTDYTDFNTDVTDKVIAPNWGMACPTT